MGLESNALPLRHSFLSSARLRPKLCWSHDNFQKCSRHFFPGLPIFEKYTNNSNAKKKSTKIDKHGIKRITRHGITPQRKRKIWKVPKTRRTDPHGKPIARNIKLCSALKGKLVQGQSRSVVYLKSCMAALMV